MFDGFSTERLGLDKGIDIHFRVGGAGPPLLLLHGYPQTHVIWHKVAPLDCGHYLAEEAPKETLAEIFEFLTID